LRLNNQIVIEWTIARVYEDFSFSKALDNVLKTVYLNKGEEIEIHQLINVGEFNNEKVYLIILNVTSSKE
jgi:rRNA maturation protein Rpf1